MLIRVTDTSYVFKKVTILLFLEKRPLSEVAYCFYQTDKICIMNNSI